MFELVVSGDTEQTFSNIAAAKSAALQRAYGLTCRTGKTEEVEVRRDGNYVGTASGHISASWRGQ